MTAVASPIVALGVVARSRRAAAGLTGGRARPLVVKRVCGPRSPGAVASVARYIARDGAAWRREGVEAVPVFDEWGEEVPVGELTARLRDWGLVPGAANLSPAAREVAAADPRGLAAVAAWPEDRRLRHVQAHHLVVSLVGPDADADALMVAGREAIQDLFVDASSRRVLWALHTDRPGRPHLHIVVKSQEERGRRARLRFDKAGETLDGLRATFARRLAALGLAVEASRREDRAELRDDILAGRAPLRVGWRHGATRSDEERPGASRRHDLAIETPLWFRAHGGEWLARQRREAQWRRKAAAQAKKTGRQYADLLRSALPAEPGTVGRLLRGRQVVRPEAQALLEALRPYFRDPAAAVESYLQMAAEGDIGGKSTKAMADWYLINRPSVFGEVTRAIEIRSTRRGLALVLPEAAGVRALVADLRPDPMVAAPRLRPEDALAIAQAAAAERAEHHRRAACGRAAASLDRLAWRTWTLFERGLPADGRAATIARHAAEAAAAARGNPILPSHPGGATPAPLVPGRGPGRIRQWGRE